MVTFSYGVAAPVRRRPHLLCAAWSRAVLLALAGVLVVGCHGDGLTPGAPQDDETLYWRLELDHHAALMSTTQPYDTLTVKAVPRNLHGEELAGFPAPTYTSTDLDHVRVTADGVVQALQPNDQPTVVLATLTIGNLKHVDSLFVVVDNRTDPPKLVSFSAHPLPGDSAKLPANGSWPPPIVSPLPALARALDATGTPIPNAPIYFSFSDPSAVTYYRRPQQFLAQRPGPLTMYASTTVYGIQMADTVPYRIGWPVMMYVDATRLVRPFHQDSVVFTPDEVQIGVGGIVGWASKAGTPVDVTFAEADLPHLAAAAESPMRNLPFPPFLFGFLLRVVSCGQGDCTSTENMLFNTDDAPRSFRVFTAPGTYEYHSALTGARGRVIVVDERS